MAAYKHGRHEHGRNLLVDPSAVDASTGEVVQTKGLIVMSRRERPLIDQRKRQRVPGAGPPGLHRLRLDPEQLLLSLHTTARELGSSVITIKKAWELLALIQQEY